MHSHWIDSQADLVALCRQLATATVLAIDTEFERRTSFYPKFALLQIAHQDNIYLIDPLKVEQCEAFKTLLENSNCTKVMHSAAEDLEVLFHSWGCKVLGLFDTQIANAFLTGELQVGYARLVEQRLDIRVDKSETQSDWLQRPLSRSQKLYAAADVAYLERLYQLLNEELKQKHLLEYFQSECEELCTHAVTELDSEYAYRQGKDAWRLNGDNLALFKRLYDWREDVARRENRTRNHIARDHQLVAIAESRPSNPRQLAQCVDLHPSARRRYGEAIIDVIDESLRQGLEPLPEIANPRDVSELKTLTNCYQNKLQQISKIHAIPANILASQRNLRQLAMSRLTGEQEPRQFKGWRARLLAAGFRECEMELKLKMRD